MKRFHVDAHVDDLQASVAFYARMFAAEPTRLEADYAKWMLEDPRINFAISNRGAAPGVDHLGLQTDSDEELAALAARVECADTPVLDDGRRAVATFPFSARRPWPANRHRRVARRRRRAARRSACR